MKGVWISLFTGVICLVFSFAAQQILAGSAAVIVLAGMSGMCLWEAKTIARDEMRKRGRL